MEINKKDNIVIINKISDSLEDFAKMVNDSYHTLTENNIIIDLSSEEIRPSSLIPFEELAQHHISLRKSFVIVGNIDFDEIEDAMVVVPTLQEAFDIIQLDEIERDLGF